jgi:hypothetical protein
MTEAQLSELRKSIEVALKRVPVEMAATIAAESDPKRIEQLLGEALLSAYDGAVCDFLARHGLDFSEVSPIYGDDEHAD